jgi:transposase
VSPDLLVRCEITIRKKERDKERIKGKKKEKERKEKRNNRKYHSALYWVVKFCFSYIWL